MPHLKWFVEHRMVIVQLTYYKRYYVCSIKKTCLQDFTNYKTFDDVINRKSI